MGENMVVILYSEYGCVCVCVCGDGVGGDICCFTIGFHILTLPPFKIQQSFPRQEIVSHISVAMATKICSANFARGKLKLGKDMLYKLKKAQEEMPDC